MLEKLGALNMSMGHRIPLFRMTFEGALNLFIILVTQNVLPNFLTNGMIHIDCICLDHICVHLSKCRYNTLEKKEDR